ncbi:MAG: hypothetical protein JWO38_1565 [Gemmataceae bacterium]|nr:hypothetical protein [Gemmataceae bacterium]
MHVRCVTGARWWNRLILAGVVALTATSAGRGQTPEAPPTPTDGPAAPPAGQGETAPSAAAGSGANERAWSGPPQKPASQKTFWETVPHITPFPRQGNFFISPSGPGFYTVVDLIRGRELKDRPKNPYLQWGQNANSFFNADFRYLDDPKNTQTDLFDPIKRLHLGDNWLFSTGGEVRDRYATIQNAALYNKKPGAGADDTFNLFRTRVYGDLMYLDVFRVYAEFLTAQSSAQSIPRASSDVAQNDFLNLFVEAKLLTLDKNAVFARLGRQELLFGSQRQISPSDWSNTRRTFQGVRAFYHTDKVEEDVFVVNPVVPSTNTISSIDDKQVFVGNWFKYRFTKDTSLDAFYLYLENANPGAATGRYKATGGFDVNTFGSRFVGQYEHVLWDFEGGLQFGGWANQQTFAGMTVAGLGYWFEHLPTTPTLWAYYDYASGDPNPGRTNVHRTYNTLFPFGHSYFAGLDAIGRQNIKDFHLELGMFPAKWMRITAGYHVMRLDQAKDALYSPSGSIVRQDLTGRSGTNVGDALSGAIQFHIDNHQMVLVNYAHLFAGDFIRGTAVTPGAAKDLDAWWFQYMFKW